MRQEETRFRRHAAQLERFVSPDGAYPVVVRSITYRFGSFQVLSQSALQGLLPEEVTPAQARCALTAVIRRHMAAEGNLDTDGWLPLGFAGHQPELAERYIPTGSLYLAACVFPALGLCSESEFWSAPFAPWSGLRAWNGGQDVKLDKALKDK